MTQGVLFSMEHLTFLLKESEFLDVVVTDGILSTEHISPIALLPKYEKFSEIRILKGISDIYINGQL